MTAAQTIIGLVPEAGLQEIQELHHNIFGAVIDHVGHIPQEKRIASSTSTTRLISGRPNREPEALTQRYIRYCQLRPVDEKEGSLPGNADCLSKKHYPRTTAKPLCTS